MAKKIKYYDDYSYEEIYDTKVLGEETPEEIIERMGREFRKCLFVVKTIQSGDMLEAEIYPVYERKGDMPKTEKKEPTNKWQKNLNDMNTKKWIVRLINSNFTKNDLMVTLTYADKYYPTEQQARRDIKNYIAKVRRYRKRNGLSELKYLYVISFMPEEERSKTKKIRMHHHIIMSEMDRDIAEDLWTKGERAEAKRLKPDDMGLTGIASYIAGNNKGGRRWAKSNNLKKPQVNKSVSKLNRRATERLALSHYLHKEIFEKMYKQKYLFVDSRMFYSEITKGFYIYANMRKNC
jgi:hypothetical protein